MEEINPNPNNELNLFKEDILTHLKELENKINEQISNKESKLNHDYNEFTAKMNSIIENNKEMISNLVTQKLKIEKISELESFKNKVDGMLITHEVRIKNNIEDIQKIKTKYDKIITDNLYVSGFIGNSCQFKNLSEYLSYNISEVSKLKMEKEQNKKDMKELKNKLDGTMKNMITLNDNSVKLCNKYTDNKQEEFRKLLEQAQTELNHKSMEMRAMIVQFNQETDQKIDNLRKDFEKLLDMKSELIDLIDKKYQPFEIRQDELNEKAINIDENIEINRKRMDIINENHKNLDKMIKDLNFQVRNYYCVSNRIAVLLEQLGSNPSKSEISRLLLGVQGNTVNNESKPNKKLSISVSPQPKRGPNKNVNLDLLKLALDDSNTTKNNINYNNNNNNNNNNIKKKIITKSVVSFSPQKKSMFNRIGLKNITLNDDDSDSETSSINIIDENTKKNDVKNTEKLKENLKPILKSNLKQIPKENNVIKQSTKENTKVNFKENTKEPPKEIIKEPSKENTKEPPKEIIKEPPKEIIKKPQKEIVKEQPKVVMKEAPKVVINEPPKEIKKENTKENSKENIKEKNTPREINTTISNKTQELPLLSKKNKEEHKFEEIKKINLSSASIDKYNIEKNNRHQNKLMIIMNNDINNKSKNNNQKNMMKKLDSELKQEQHVCKIVDLSLPEDTLTQPYANNNIKNKSRINNNGKYDLVNSLINDYRAKIFSKAHSPVYNIDVTNDLLDIPKKVSQAFGRTTYTFYFKKDAIDCANANKNINNFGYYGPKKGYKIKNNKRADTGNFKGTK